MSYITLSKSLERQTGVQQGRLNPLTPDIHHCGAMVEKNILIFGLIWLCCSVGHGQMDTNVPCDDKRVENVVNLALSKYNELLTEGSQLALYDIKEATKVCIQLCIIFFFGIVFLHYITT